VHRFVDKYSVNVPVMYQDTVNQSNERKNAVNLNYGPPTLPRYTKKRQESLTHI